MEQSLQALALIYPHVIVRRVYQNEHYIPLRLRQVVGVDWFFISPAYPEASASQLALWQANRGILVNTHETTHVKKPLPRHDAILFAECPTSLYRIEADTRFTEHCAVIYHPPTWREHEKHVDTHCPSVDQCKAAYLWMKQHPEPSTDATLVQKTGITCSPVSIRFLLYAHGGLIPTPTLVPIKTRYAPDHPQQLKLYEWLLEQPITTQNGYRYIEEQKLIGYAHGWRKLLNRMRKEGVIDREELLHTYVFKDQHPNWEYINRQYRTLRGEFDRVQALVGAAPEFPHLGILSGQYSPESI